MYCRNFSDHELADYLRNEKVIDNFSNVESFPIVEYWRNTQLVAVIVYNNEKCERVIYTYNREFYSYPER